MLAARAAGGGLLATDESALDELTGSSRADHEPDRRRQHRLDEAFEPLTEPVPPQ